MAKVIDYSVVVPVYNAEVCLEELAAKLIKSLSNLTNDFEIIFVDDASSDSSWELCKVLKKSYPDQIIAIRLSKNFGQHNATMCGIKHASGAYIITIDDDLEFEPVQIPLLIEQMQSGKYQVVYGVGNDSKSMVRKALTYLVKKTVRLVNGKQSAQGSSFRLIETTLAKKIVDQAHYFSMIDEFLTWYTDRIGFVLVDRNVSKKGTSSYSLWRLAKMVIETIFFSSSIPLQSLRKLGIFMILLNGFWALLVLYRKVVDSIAVDGYTSLIIAILFSTGFIMMGLTIIAEYLHKAILVVYKKPPFNEDEIA